MIKIIAAALVCLASGAANATLFETYQYSGIVQRSDMVGVSVGSQFSGTISLDLRDLGSPSSSNGRSAIWSNESGCKEFVNGSCSHTRFDDQQFMRVTLHVDGHEIPVPLMSYGQWQLGQYASPNQTGYQLTNYTSTRAIRGDVDSGKYDLSYEFQQLQFTLTSLLQLFDDYRVAEQPDLTVALNSADFSYWSGMGSCSNSHNVCDVHTGQYVNNTFGGEITSIHLFGDGHDVPEPGGLVWLGLALVAWSVARQARRGLRA